VKPKATGNRYHCWIGTRSGCNVKYLMQFKLYWIKLVVWCYFYFVCCDFNFCAVSRLNRMGSCGLIHLTHYRDQWQAATNTEINHLFPQRRIISLLAEPLLSTPFFWDTTLRHWVNGSWRFEETQYLHPQASRGLETLTIKKLRSFEISGTDYPVKRGHSYEERRTQPHGHDNLKHSHEPQLAFQDRL
jgi:hypothetical protein